jgi:ATP-dependent DNA helicase RecQ
LAKKGAYAQTLEFLRSRPKESGIIYCQARKSAESLAARLSEDGVHAKPYHAGLTTAERTRNQDLFIRDEVRVICATIAFGMGINKPNVRFVIHYDLPKNVEGYYQETGRAGRDGLPSDCLLLFSAGDVVKYSQFIDEKPDPREQEVARRQLQQVLHYCECGSCRRRELLHYFGESYESENCAACDNCLSPRQTFDGTIAAQKFLSCIYRVRQQSGFDFGINQIAEVLTGADTESVRKWKHQKLSTYGIGKEYTREQWKVIGRELVRQGLVEQRAEKKFTVLRLTPEGLALLKARKKVTLTKPVTAPEPKALRVGDIACDEALFERLRALRKRLADSRNLPPYIIFSDVSLRQMARQYPANEQEFGRISGVGELKLRDYGPAFLSEIAAYLQGSARQIFADDSFVAPSAIPARARLSDTIRDTLRRFRSNQSIEQIASERLLTVGTIYGHLAEAMLAGEGVDLEQFFTSDQLAEVATAFNRVGFANLSGVFEALGGRYEYGKLRLFRAANAGSVAKQL